MGTQEYIKAYNSIANKRGIGIREMLVLLKAYARYKADEELGKPENECGWMSETYDILPCFNRFGEELIYIPDSFAGAEEFWESDSNNKHWRLSESGLMFVDDNQKLYDAFVGVSSTVLEA